MRFLKNHRLFFSFVMLLTLTALEPSAADEIPLAEDVFSDATLGGETQVKEAILKGFNVNEFYSAHKDSEEMTLLLHAIKWRRPGIISLLIKYGADMELKTKSDITPLNMSIRYATARYSRERAGAGEAYIGVQRMLSMEIFDVLLAHSADVNHQSTFAGASTLTTPLEVAAGGPDFLSVLAVTIKLLDAGADVNPAIDKKHPTSPLFSALGGAASIKGDHRGALIKLLLDAGADPNATLPDGTSPLHIAAAMDSAYVKPLLKAGADKRLKDANGMTAFGIALRKLNFRVLFTLAFN